MSIVRQTRRKILLESFFDSISDLDLRAVLYFLKRKHVDPNQLYMENMSALHLAASIRDQAYAIKVLKECLKYGGDPNVRGEDGLTPIQVAAIWEQHDVMEFLTTVGGDPVMLDDDDFSAEEYEEMNYQLFWVDDDPRLQGYFHQRMVPSWRDTQRRRSLLVELTEEERRINMSVTESQSSCSRISNRLSYSFADDSVDDLLNYGFLEDDEDLPTILSNIVFSDIPSSFCFSEIHVSDGDQASTHYHCPLVDQRYHPLENVDRDMTLGFNEGFFIHSKPDEMISIDEGLLDIDKIRQSISRLSLETEYYDALDSQFNSSGGSLSSCPTAKLKCMLREHQIPHGPLVKSTKRVYLYQLQKASNGLKGSSHVINHAYETTTKSTPLEYNDVVISTFNGKLMECVSKWVSLELAMIEMIEVLDQPQLKLDLFKQYFTYLLLDPTISKNIEGSVCPETVCQSWPYFLKAVFYIGKGKNSRPLDHLTDAVKGDKLSDKIRKIRTIWEKGLGVVCIKIFHNINEPEALTREATMINALSISHLTNQQNGKCYGGIERWSLKKRRQLGVVLLYRSMLTLIAEGQRQIFATDIRR